MKVLVRITAAAISLSLTACLLVEDQGSTETSVGTPVVTPPDFNVSDGNPELPPVSDGDQDTQPTPVDPDFIEEGFVIENGASRTAKSTLDLRLITLNRFQMKISTDQRCEGGQWQPWQEFLTIPTSSENALNMISVQYKDWDGMAGHCYRQSILHDGQGPDILFSKYPLASLEEGSTADVIAEVTDSAGTVASVTCSLNGLQKACLAGRNEIGITQLPAGDYTFKVSATDDLGNASEKSVSWSVVSLTRKLSQSIRVNNYKKVDILMVIDNSGSMDYEQKNMAQRTGTLLSVIRGLDYQIAVTTTDPRDIALGDGRFIPMVGGNGRLMVDSTMSETTAQTQLSKTLQRAEVGSGVEQGIRNTYRVVDRYNANENAARAFFRSGAQFAVVLISDEDESDNGSKNDPQKLVNVVNSSFGGQKMFSFHSIIAKPGDSSCLKNGGATYGDRYKMMSDLTGGVIGSVCASDYSSQVTGIAQGIRDLLKTLTLQCAPIAGKPLTIKRDGVVINATYKAEGVNLKFDAELEPGDYSVDYQCLK